MNTPTDDADVEVAQEGDMAEVAQEAPHRMRETRNRMLVGSDANQAARHPMAMGEQVGGARAATQAEEPGEIRYRRGEGRRTNLRRSSDGSYSLWMGGRLIQSFCSEWEDITRFQLPEGIQQQVRVNVQSLGEAREWDGDESPRGDDERVEVAVDAVDDGVELRSIEHPHNPMPPVDPDDLIGMFNALPAHNRSLIERQIRANWAGINVAERPEITDLHAAVEDHRQMLRAEAPPVPEGGDVWEHILGLLQAELHRVHDLIGTVETMRQR